MTHHPLTRKPPPSDRGSISSTLSTPSMLSTLFRDAQPSLQPTRTNFQKSCERFPLSSEERAVVLRPREREKVAAGRMRAVGIKTNPVVRRSFPLTSFSFRGTTPVVRPPLKAIPPYSEMGFRFPAFPLCPAAHPVFSGIIYCTIDYQRVTSSGLGQICLGIQSPPLKTQPKIHPPV